MCTDYFARQGLSRSDRRVDAGWMQADPGPSRSQQISYTCHFSTLQKPGRNWLLAPTFDHFAQLELTDLIYAFQNIQVSDTFIKYQRCAT